MANSSFMKNLTSILLLIPAGVQSITTNLRFQKPLICSDVFTAGGVKGYYYKFWFFEKLDLFSLFYSIRSKVLPQI